VQYNVAFIQFHTGYDMYINLFDSIMEKLARKYEEPKTEKGRRRACLLLSTPVKNNFWKFIVTGNM
jgi:hypothetical protein